jgi:hypothetical protein
VRVLYSNDLWSERTLRAGRNGGCAWGYADGGWVLANPAGSSWCYYDFLDQNYRGPIRIEVTAHLRSGAQNWGFGIRFGVPSGANPDFYLFEIAANGGHKLWQYRSGQFFQLYPWRNDDVVRRGYGSANRLAVEIQGTTIHTILNGQRVGSAQTAGDVRGHFGFVVRQRGMDVLYKDLRVLGLPGSP